MALWEISVLLHNQFRMVSNLLSNLKKCKMDKLTWTRSVHHSVMEVTLRQMVSKRPPTRLNRSCSASYEKINLFHSNDTAFWLLGCVLAWKLNDITPPPIVVKLCWIFRGSMNLYWSTLIVESWVFWSKHEAKTQGCDVILYAVRKQTREYWAIVRESALPWYKHHLPSNKTRDLDHYWMEAMQLVSTCMKLVSDQFSGEERREREILI